MKQTLTDLWTRYKKLIWWKKALLALPLLVAIVAVIVFLFWKSSDGGKLEDAVRYGKEQVDARVQDNVEQDKKLVAKDKKLAAQQAALRQDIQTHEQEAAKTNSDIVNAADDSDITALTRLHRELNSKQRRGAASVRLGVAGTTKGNK